MAYTVQASTSVVLLDTSLITAAHSTAVVLVGGGNAPGRTVTIRDSIGYLSSPNTILVSTTAGVQFQDGTTTFQMYDPFSYVTLGAKTANTWNIVNSFGFNSAAAGAYAYDTITAGTVTTSTLTVLGQLCNTDITVNTLRTKALTVTSSVNFSQISSIDLGHAVAQASILNVSTAYLSSFNVNTLYTDTFYLSSFSTTSLTILSSFTNANPYSQINTYGVNAYLISTGQLTFSSLVGNHVYTSSITTEELTVNTSFTTLPGASVSLPSAYITVNEDILTSSLHSQSVRTHDLYTSTLTFGSIPELSTGSILASNIYFSSFSTTTLATNSAYINTLTLGTSDVPPIYTINDARVMDFSNVTVVSGGTDYFSTYTVTIDPPPGHPSNSTFTFDFEFNIQDWGQVVPPVFANWELFYYSPNGALDGGWKLYFNADLGSFEPFLDVPDRNGQYPATSTIYRSIGNDTPLYDVATIPQPGSLPVRNIGLRGEQTPANSSNFSFTFYLSPPSLVNPSTFINMNYSVLQWQNPLNDITIRNSLNDIATRNLFYYGALTFASDPRLKTDIQYANLELCSNAIASLPLKRYQYKSEYCSTFHVLDSHRLGFLTTDVQTVFPKSVVPVRIPDTPFGTMNTLDMQQIDMAHLGTTQLLMQRVKDLETQLQEILKSP